MSDSNIQDAINAGAATVRAQNLALGDYYVVVDTNGGITQIDLTGNQWRALPQRISRSLELSDQESFLGYWAKHANSNSELYASTLTWAILGIIDGPGGDDVEASERPAWESHKVTVRLERSPELRAWQEWHDRPMSQVQFAEMVEDRIATIADPDGAQLVEMTRVLFRTSGSTFRSSYVDGAHRLEYSEDTDTQTKIKDGYVAAPTKMVLRVPLWLNGPDDVAQIPVRIRYNNDTRKLQITYHLDHAAISRAQNDSFNQVVEAVAAGTNRDVWRT